MKHKILLFFCFLIASSPLNSFALSSSNYENADEIDITNHEYILPAGTFLPVVLMDIVSTENGVTGQPLTAMIAQDIFVGQKKVLSRSDQVLGNVMEVQQPFEGRNAILKVDFNILALASGLKIPLLSNVDTGQKEHYWGGEMTLGTKTVVVPYNVHRIGNYGRVMYYGPRAMGEHIRFLPGARITLILKEPLILYVY